MLTFEKLQELDATFDRVVSIEMIEAVGHENLPGVLQCVAVCCSVLQCVAVCCSVL